MSTDAQNDTSADPGVYDWTSYWNRIWFVARDAQRRMQFWAMASIGAIYVGGALVGFAAASAPGAMVGSIVGSVVGVVGVASLLMMHDPSVGKTFTHVLAMDDQYGRRYAEQLYHAHDKTILTIAQLRVIMNQEWQVRVEH